MDSIQYIVLPFLSKEKFSFFSTHEQIQSYVTPMIGKTSKRLINHGAGGTKVHVYLPY